MLPKANNLVFISHSRQNSGAALKLCDALLSRGVSAWLDLREVDSGTDWNEKVSRAIRDASGFVFLIGPSAADDRWQKFEWQKVAEQESYLDASKPLIPVLIGQPEIPGFLRSRVAISINEPDIDFGTLAGHVLKALNEPQSTIDPENAKKSHEERVRALSALRKYSKELDEQTLERGW